MESADSNGRQPLLLTGHPVFRLDDNFVMFLPAFGFGAIALRRKSTNAIPDGDFGLPLGGQNLTACGTSPCEGEVDSHAGEPLVPNLTGFRFLSGVRLLSTHQLSVMTCQQSRPLFWYAQRALNLIQIQKWSFGMWETSPPAAPLLLKERFDKTLVPLLSKERLGEVLPDHTKLQVST